MSIVQVVACSCVDGGCVVVFLVSKLCGYCGVGCLGQCVFSGGEDLVVSLLFVIVLFL